MSREILTASAKKERKAEYGRKRYAAHRLLYIEKARKWVANHREHRKKYQREWQAAHRSSCREYAREWCATHRSLCRGYNRKWDAAHREQSRHRKAEVAKKHRSTLSGKLNDRMTAAIKQSLSKNKNGRKWQSLVGYTLKELKQYLESKFTEGMSWDNYGKWHVDHIIPKSRFHFVNVDNLDFKACWALSNLQPLWAFDNRSKGSRTMEQWVKSKNKQK